MPAYVLPVTATTLRDATIGFFAYLLVLFVGSIALPGIRRTGFPQPDGRRDEYKLSGFTLFIATHVVVGVGTWLFGLSLAPLVTHFWSLFIVVNAFAFLASGWLFWRGRHLRASIEREGRLPPTLHDLWFGVELNPRLAGVDLKMFAYHPSLLGVMLVNWGFAYVQFERYGAVTLEMGLYLIFWFLYLFTHYVKEEFMLSTWDIIAERFGFMLVWGDLVYVPFLYSLPGWWVVSRGWTSAEEGFVHSPLPVWSAALLVLFHLLSLWIFRGSNWQKDRFKRDPNVHIWGKPAETLGGRLLVSGWWGIGRKINYTGEIGVYLSFAMCAGFSTPWPYILPLTLIILLTQRAGRDDRRCRAKYGALWEDYCRRARFRIFPLVY